METSFDRENSFSPGLLFQIVEKPIDPGPLLDGVIIGELQFRGVAQADALPDLSAKKGGCMGKEGR